jgi:hypothetical protein
MNLFRSRGGDAEEREPGVRSLHRIMERAANEPSLAASNDLIRSLMEAELWTIEIADVAHPSATGGVEVRIGRTRDGEVFFPVGTTKARLIAWGGLEPGDMLVRAPFRVLAGRARASGAYSLVINPGSVPMGRIAGPALATVADGGIPDAADPGAKATVKTDQLGPIDRIDIHSLPPGMADAAVAALRAETTVEAASLVQRSLGMGRAYVLLVVVNSETVRSALADELARHVSPFIGERDYVLVEHVLATDPRLTHQDRAIVLIPVRG